MENLCATNLKKQKNKEKEHKTIIELESSQQTGKAG